ncbi:zinc finger protein 91-like [Saccostrea echinata]|uniref:zinc finger protein 91-like n=1 Tax=Saccostrea echinata TaxID=191078 RepID=UPI002A817C0E|nr:zinc finger protein 91-like [Saccostrea echinata]
MSLKGFKVSSDGSVTFVSSAGRLVKDHYKRKRNRYLGILALQMRRKKKMMNQQQKMLKGEKAAFSSCSFIQSSAEKLNNYGAFDNQTENLERHNKTHVIKKPDECNICGKTFNCPRELRRHMRTHTGDKRYKCDKCGKTLSRSGHLLRHMKTHTGEKPFKCDLCEKAYYEKSDLNMHLRTHTCDKQYKCNICGRVFSTSGNLIRHMRTHTGVKPYKCDVCGKAFSVSGVLQRHKKIHTGEKHYKCDICQKMFREKSELKEHLRTHTDEKPCKRNPYKCDVCGKFVSYHLQRHMRIHAAKRYYKCNMCRIIFRAKSILKMHFRTHTGVLDQFSFQTSDSLQHPRSCRGEKFSKCDKVCSHSNNIQRHNSTYLGKDPDKCEVCGKVFSKLVYLRRHKKIHTSEKPHKCDKYGKEFSEKEHVCQEPFIENIDLERHERTQECKNPFVDMGRRVSHQIGQFDKQIRISTDRRSSMCQVCGKMVTCMGTHSENGHVCQEPFIENIDLERHERTQECKNPFVDMGRRVSHQIGQFDKQIRISTDRRSSMCQVCGKMVTCMGTHNENGHVCQEPFIENIDLERHERTQKCKNPFVDMGRRVSHQIGQLDKQIRISTDRRSSMCPVCGKMVTCMGTQSENGHVCQEPFIENIDLERHERTQKCENPFVDMGRRVSHQIGQLDKQIRISTDRRSSMCPVCGKMVTCMGTHIRTQMHQKSYNCILCEKTYNLKHSLKKHIMTHTGEKPCKCDVCGRAFKEAWLLQRHMMIHTGDKPYKCDVCWKAFNRLGTVQIHMKTHTGDKPSKCGVCGKAFMRLWHLKRHIITHKDEKPNKCNEKAFNQSRQLQRHLGLHTSEKRYQCDVCGKLFKEKGTLMIHMRIHTGYKPYKCDVCGKLFIQSGGFKKHQRTHTGEKPYKCDMCGKTFTDSSNLLRHKMTHTGKKPFKCNVCLMTFRQSEHLKTHLRTRHTGEKLY